MKLYLDNQRDAPEGWLAVRWPEEAILLLATGEVTDLSLDHEFGNGICGKVDEVFDWITVAVTKHGFKAPVITVHSTNATQQQRLQERAVAITQLVPAKVKTPRTKTVAKTLHTAESALPGKAGPIDTRRHGQFRGVTSGKSQSELAPTGISLSIPDADNVCTAYRAAKTDQFERYAADRSAERLAEHHDHVSWHEQMFRKYWFYRLGTNFGSEPASRMNDGFTYGPGWRPLLEQLSERLLILLGPAETAPVYLEVLQVKEKMGGLRFYYRMYNRSADAFEYERLAQAIRTAVDDACAASLTICEECGQPGSLRPGNHITTLCDDCAG